MEIEKYKKIAKIIVVLIVFLLLIVFFILPKASDYKESGIGKNEEGISTDTPFDASNYDNGKLVQDYLNPTDDEIGAITQRYGVDNYVFNEQGLYVYAVNDDEENRLYTDVWPDTAFTNMVLKPDLDMYLIEVGQTYLVINLEKVTEKELKQYIKSIEDDFSRELYSRHSETLYRAVNEKNIIVDIQYYPNTSTAYIRYDYQNY
ncbi:MAG: hypothetical protein IJX99_01925 [Clostridia bacterium]|nr:hypothetical protein [Clostridia bacterium]